MILEHFEIWKKKFVQILNFKNFFEKFSKIEHFQNALKSLIILRFCSNEHVIEMRWFSVEFWQKKILKNFLKNFRISENPIKFCIFFQDFAHVPGMLHVHRFGTFSKFFKKLKLQYQSFPTSCLGLSGDPYLRF